MRAKQVSESWSAVRAWAAQILGGYCPDTPPLLTRIPVDEWLHILVAEGVAPLLHAALARSPTIAVPQALVTGLQQHAHVGAARQVLDDDAVRRSLALLDDAGISPLIIKGTALAYLLYDAPHLRPRVDCDVLIPPDSLEPARTAFRGAGCDTAPNCLGHYLTHQFTATCSDRLGMQHAFDVHRRVNNSLLVSAALPLEDLVGQAVALPMLGPAARVPCPRHALAIACLHLAAGRDYPRLIWLYDIHLLVLALDDSEVAAFWRWAEASRMVGICRHYIRMSCALMRLELDGKLWAPLFLDATAFAVEPSAALLAPEVSYRKLRWLDCRSLPTWKAQARYVQEFLFPPVAHIRERYALESSGVLAVAAAYGRRLAGRG